MSRVLAQTPADGELPPEANKTTLSMIMAPRSKHSHKLKALTQSQHAALPHTARATHKRKEEHARNGAMTERCTTGKKNKVAAANPLRELSLSISAQKIQTTIENGSNNGACDTSRTMQVQRKDATIEQVPGPGGSSNSSMVIYDRGEEETKGSQTAPAHKSKPGLTSRSKLSSQLQTRLMLSIERVSRTPALKVPASAQSARLATTQAPRESSVPKSLQKVGANSPRPTPDKRNKL